MPSDVRAPATAITPDGQGAAGTHNGMRQLSLDGRRFFSRDGLLEIWYALVVDDLEATAPSSESTPWERALTAEWRSQATVRFEGVMTADLDPYVKAEGPRAALRARCESLRDRLASDELAPGPLARRVAQKRWDHPQTRPGLLRIAEAMLWLLTDQPASGEESVWLQDEVG